MTRYLLSLALIVFATAGNAQTAPSGRPASPGATSRFCPPGFAAIPDASTCIRISGRVRSQIVTGTTARRGDDRARIGAEGRLGLDARTRTDYGILRTVIRIEDGKR